MFRKRHSDSTRSLPVARLLDSHADDGGRKWVRRLRSDFRLAMITLFGVCACLVITPFALFRFSVGDYLIGFADLLIVAGFVSLMAYAWKTGKTALVGSITASFASMAAIAMLLFLELNHSWIFAALVANFLLATRVVAIGVSAALIAFVTHILWGTVPSLELTTIISVAVLMSMFALIFASQVDSQHRQLTDLAMFDPLTGAGNRRMLKVDLAAMVGRSRHVCEAYTLAVLDLDHFKQVNDEHGHEAGDQVLMDLARIVQQYTRRSDRFYRFGGEEFVLLMPETDADKAKVALDKLLTSIREQLKGPAGPVTVSIGAAELRRGEEAVDWLGRADRALYEAKHRGRDCLVVDDDNQAESGGVAPMERREMDA